MKKHQISCVLLLATAGAVLGGVPKNPPLSSYNKLWNESPFTTKPPPPEAGPQVNALDDYALIGVSPIGQSNYRVTLINKKQPDERIIVDSGEGREGFKVLGVIRKPGDPLGTVVQMTAGASSGTVAFDEKLLTLAAPPAPPAAVQQPVPGQPPQQGQPDPNQPRAVRPRVVPPPPAQAGQPQPQQNQNRGERRQRRRN